MSSNQDDFAPKPKWFLFMTITRPLNSFSDLKPCKIIHLFSHLCIKRKELFWPLTRQSCSYNQANLMFSFTCRDPIPALTSQLPPFELFIPSSGGRNVTGTQHHRQTPFLKYPYRHYTCPVRLKDFIVCAAICDNNARFSLRWFSRVWWHASWKDHSSVFSAEVWAIHWWYTELNSHFDTFTLFN